MFSVKEKQYLASVIEKALLELDHPEMPKVNPDFSLHVKGKETWSWADIHPNWKFGVNSPPKVNPFNEMSRKIHETNQKAISPLTEDYVKGTCKPGTDDCCRYLLLGKNGWGCAKLISRLKQHFDDRVADGNIKAVGDNCPGVPNTLVFTKEGGPDGSENPKR